MADSIVPKFKFQGGLKSKYLAVQIDQDGNYSFSFSVSTKKIIDSLISFLPFEIDLEEVGLIKPFPLIPDIELSLSLERVKENGGIDPDIDRIIGHRWGDDPQIKNRKFVVIKSGDHTNTYLVPENPYEQIEVHSGTQKIKSVKVGQTIFIEIEPGDDVIIVIPQSSLFAAPVMALEIPGVGYYLGSVNFIGQNIFEPHGIGFLKFNDEFGRRLGYQGLEASFRSGYINTSFDIHRLSFLGGLRYRGEYNDSNFYPVGDQISEGAHFHLPLPEGDGELIDENSRVIFSGTFSSGKPVQATSLLISCVGRQCEYSGSVTIYPLFSDNEPLFSSVVVPHGRGLLVCEDGIEIHGEFQLGTPKVKRAFWIKPYWGVYVGEFYGFSPNGRGAIYPFHFPEWVNEDIVWLFEENVRIRIENELWLVRRKKARAFPKAKDQIKKVAGLLSNLIPNKSEQVQLRLHAGFSNREVGEIQAEFASKPIPAFSQRFRNIEETNFFRNMQMNGGEIEAQSVNHDYKDIQANYFGPLSSKTLKPEGESGYLTIRRYKGTTLRYKGKFHNGLPVEYKSTCEINDYRFEGVKKGILPFAGKVTFSNSMTFEGSLKELTLHNGTLEYLVPDHSQKDQLKIRFCGEFNGFQPHGLGVLEVFDTETGMKLGYYHGEMVEGRIKELDLKNISLAGYGSNIFQLPHFVILKNGDVWGRYIGAYEFLGVVPHGKGVIVFENPFIPIYNGRVNMMERSD